MTFTGCGIAGLARFDGADLDLAEVVRATRALAHRGPNGEGFWAAGSVAFGHRRLSFLDLGDDGAQPMTRDHLTLVYNGELYNFAELRRELKHHHRFESGSDTEVVLRAWQRWGPQALNRFNGMYAFALWDAHSRRLVLARDRIGIKPLYYHRGDSFLAFASEVEALLRFQAVPGEPDLAALHDQLLRSSTLETDRTRTLVRGVHAVPPAAWLAFDDEGRATSHTYWRLPEPSRTANRTADAARELRELVGHGVRSMLTADVPIAAFLSGGLDSSAINAVAAEAGPLTSITVAYAERADGPPDQDGNEDLHYSRLLAASAAGRIDHRVVIRPHGVDLADVDAVCDLAAFCDDVRHVSILGNYRAVAKSGLRGVLNGQGADETMGGYVGLPGFARTVLDVQAPSGATIAALPAARQVQGLTREVLAGRERAHRTVLDFHAGLHGPPLERAHRLLVHTQLSRIVQFEDFLSMRAGVEGRFPYLDHRIVEWAFSRPFQAHVARPEREGKVLLRAAMGPLLPARVGARRKQVFPHPDRAGLHRSLATLADSHEEELRADPLVPTLLELPARGSLGSLSPEPLWVLLSVWRWHARLRSANSASPGTASGAPPAGIHVRASISARPTSDREVPKR